MKNTRCALLLAGFCLFALIALAQPHAGLKVGVNYSSLSGYAGDHRVNLHAGVFVQVLLDKRWNLRPELLYSGEGQHFIIPVDGEEHGEAQGLITLDYITLPVLFRYTIVPRFYLEAGPQFSLLVAAHSKGLGTDDMNIKRSFSNSQFGLSLGTGFSINERFGIYGRYTAGMTDITAGSGDSNKCSTGQLGISFRLRKQNISAAIADMPEK